MNSSAKIKCPICKNKKHQIFITRTTKDDKTLQYCVMPKSIVSLREEHKDKLGHLPNEVISRPSVLEDVFPTSVVDMTQLVETIEEEFLKKTQGISGHPPGKSKKRKQREDEDGEESERNKRHKGEQVAQDMASTSAIVISDSPSNHSTVTPTTTTALPDTEAMEVEALQAEGHQLNFREMCKDVADNMNNLGDLLDQFRRTITYLTKKCTTLQDERDEARKQAAAAAENLQAQKDLEEKDKVIVEKDKVIEERTKQLEEKDKQLEDRNKQLKILEAKLKLEAIRTKESCAKVTDLQDQIEKQKTLYEEKLRAQEEVINSLTTQ